MRLRSAIWIYLLLGIFGASIVLAQEPVDRLKNDRAYFQISTQLDTFPVGHLLWINGQDLNLDHVKDTIRGELVIGPIIINGTNDISGHHSKHFQAHGGQIYRFEVLKGNISGYKLCIVDSELDINQCLPLERVSRLAEMSTKQMKRELSQQKQARTNFVNDSIFNLPKLVLGVNLGLGDAFGQSLSLEFHNGRYDFGLNAGYSPRGRKFGISGEYIFPELFVFHPFFGIAGSYCPNRDTMEFASDMGASSILIKPTWAIFPRIGAEHFYGRFGLRVLAGYGIAVRGENFRTISYSSFFESDSSRSGDSPLYEWISSMSGLELSASLMVRLF